MAPPRPRRLPDRELPASAGSTARPEAPGASVRAEDLEWVSPYTEPADRAMAERGFRRVRMLDRLHRPLPVTAEHRGGHDAAVVRPFDPERDTDDVLDVNNRAFSWHPDQSGWDAERLRSRLAEDWVDLDGFLVHEGADGRVDGFCWTRVHPGQGGRPAEGEIFLIAADPDRHGTGLGRALVLAGLDHLASSGLASAFLYVESDNQPALRLYQRLGFSLDHRDAGYAPVDLRIGDGAGPDRSSGASS